MRVAIALPRNMTFSEVGATSIDLCVSELIRESRYKETTTVYHTLKDETFEGLNAVGLKKHRFLGNIFRAIKLIRLFKSACPDIIVVHQNIDIAVILSLTTNRPVLFYTHNEFSKPVNILSQRIKYWKLKTLSTVIFVSEFCLQTSEKNFPDLDFKRHVIYNGVRLQSSNLTEIKQKKMLVVGRALPEKGIVEALTAINSIFEKFGDWTADVVIDPRNCDEDYLRLIQSQVELSGGRISVFNNLRHEDVLKLTSAAFVAFTLSKHDEPFGRTALETLACNTNLISSGRGGLKEASSVYASYVDPEDKDAVRNALEEIILKYDADPGVENGRYNYVRDNFDIKICSSRLDDIFKSTITNL